MIKKLLPLVLALVGLGVGVAAGVALKPAPEPVETVAGDCAAPAEADAGEGHAVAEVEAAAEVAPCEPETDDPFAKVEAPEGGHEAEGEVAYVPLDKPFVVPVFRDDRVAAMVVLSLSVAVGAEAQGKVEAVQPRLRDSFLKVMFQHANSGGFDGSFTTGQKLADLHAALLGAARGILGTGEVGEILITEIARQDV